MVVLVWAVLGALSAGLVGLSTWGMAVGSVAVLSGDAIQAMAETSLAVVTWAHQPRGRGAVEARNGHDPRT